MTPVIVSESLSMGRCVGVLAETRSLVGRIVRSLYAREGPSAEASYAKAELTLKFRLQVGDPAPVVYPLRPTPNGSTTVHQSPVVENDDVALEGHKIQDGVAVVHHLLEAPVCWLGVWRYANDFVEARAKPHRVASRRNQHWPGEL